MLVLTRKRHEQIRIGDQITVTVLKVSASKVQIGIEAPAEVHIVRGELGPLAPHETERRAGADSTARAPLRSALRAVLPVECG